MKMFLSLLLLFQTMFSLQLLSGQTISAKYNKFGELIVSHLSTSLFPHRERNGGHVYKNENYSFEEHYNDSTVLIFIPKGFEPKDETDFVIHFHGWNNNVDSVLSQFKLIEQFCECKKNAILIIPQGPKNSPDSFGGKLEDENGFRNLINEIVEILYQKEIIRSKLIGNIILSGHSGGYHVISYILMRGGLTENIKEVFLFDGLYGQIEKYAYWLDHYDGKFINIFTQNGGTKKESENLMECLDAWNMRYIYKIEPELSSNDLKNNRIIFIYTDLEHNEVISARSQFMKFLKASCLEEF